MGRGSMFLVHSRRRIFQIRLYTDDPDRESDLIRRIEEVFAPTFAPTPKAVPDDQNETETETETEDEGEGE